METQLLVRTFKDLGFNSHEAKCYLALLERGTLTVGEISKLAGIPRTNAYDSLEKLTSKGMCIERPGDTKKYSASDPAILREKFLMERDKTTETELESLRRKEKEILENARAEKERVEKVVNELSPRYEKGALETNPLDYIEILKDPYQIHKKFMQLVGEAKEEILAFTKPPYAGTKEMIEEQVEQQVRLIKGGLRMRSILEVPRDKTMMEWLNAYIAEGAKYGDQMRVAEELPMKMAIFDSRTVLFTLEDPVSRQISVTTQVVEHRALARTLRVTFEAFWAQAKEYHVLKDPGR